MSGNTIDTSGNKTLESWVVLYTNGLYSWALYKTSNKESAKDMVQDTFLTAHQQFSKFRGESSPQTRLLAILNNKIKVYYRKIYKESSKSGGGGKWNTPLFGQMFDENDRWKDSEKPMSWHSNESHLLDDYDFNRVLSSCLGKLPEHWLSAINLKYIEQKRGEVICQELDIAPTNFWQIIHRAKLQLRKCLEINWFKT